MKQSAREADQFLPLYPAKFYVLAALQRGDSHGYAIMSEVAAMRLTPSMALLASVQITLPITVAGGVVVIFQSLVGQTLRRRFPRQPARC